MVDFPGRLRPEDWDSTIQLNQRNFPGILRPDASALWTSEGQGRSYQSYFEGVSGKQETQDSGKQETDIMGQSESEWPSKQTNNNKPNIDTVLRKVSAASGIILWKHLKGLSV